MQNIFYSAILLLGGVAIAVIQLYLHHFAPPPAMPVQLELFGLRFGLLINEDIGKQSQINPASIVDTTSDQIKC
ncbi:hypothetical protein CEXT_74391 [Caerostris extrusa]|uniref:Uncharacterized protein n=1 Tax=Caerostris extrusa TaxID=172846 RepID=A0AAV4VE69_CAEEX|nr:hypothetical protein CEXT_74391 [Caerostris extrusa]